MLSHDQKDDEVDQSGRTAVEHAASSPATEAHSAMRRFAAEEAQYGGPRTRDDVVGAITAARATLREAAFAKASEAGGRPTPDEPRAVAEQALPLAGRSHRR